MRRVEYLMATGSAAVPATEVLNPAAPADACVHCREAITISRMRAPMVAAALAALALVLGTAAAASGGPSTRVRLVDLGTLGGGHSQAYAMNERGDVVGVSSAATDGDAHPVLWRDGRIIDLGGAGGLGTSATSVNNRGQVVGCVAGRVPSEWEAFLWDDGRRTTLAVGCATAINDKGQVVGGRLTPSGGWRAFLWQQGTVMDLGTLDGLDSFATGINDRGQVIGVLSNNYQQRTFIWQEGAMTDLGNLGGPGSSPSGINNHGQVIGTSSVDTEGTMHPFLWEGGRLTDLLSRYGGKYAYAFDLNNFGEVVGQIDGRPFLWRDGNLLLDTEFRNGQADAINDRGHVAGVAAALNTDAAGPFLWQRGRTTYLDTLGGSYTSIVGIDRHDRVAGSSTTPGGQTHAVVWIITS